MTLSGRVEIKKNPVLATNTTDCAGIENNLQNSTAKCKLKNRERTGSRAVQ